MANAFIPRPQVHAWSEEIGQQALAHQAALQRLLKDQRRLTRFLEENQEQMDAKTASVTVYMIGVIARMFDLAGGQLRRATWAQIREAERKIHAQLDALLPIDDGTAERFRTLDRAQPHILDEAWMALFEVEPSDEEVELDPKESLKILLLSWVVTEVLDANWKPPKSFEGASDYAYVHIDPPKRDHTEDEALATS